MTEFIAEKSNGELDYKTPCLMEIAVPAGVVRGESGPVYGEQGEEEIPGELAIDG